MPSTALMGMSCKSRNSRRTETFQDNARYLKTDLTPGRRSPLHSCSAARQQEKLSADPPATREGQATAVQPSATRQA